MMQVDLFYRCPTCKTVSNKSICPKCNSATHEIGYKAFAVAMNDKIAYRNANETEIKNSKPLAQTYTLEEG